MVLFLIKLTRTGPSGEELQTAQENVAFEKNPTQEDHDLLPSVINFFERGQSADAKEATQRLAAVKKNKKIAQDYVNMTWLVT